MTLAELLRFYVFPIQVAIGMFGNILNLIVLLSKGMRSKTNTVLAVMAIADMLFLLFMLPHTIIRIEKILQITEFKRLIIYMHCPLTGIVNMCSFASAWLIVMVSVERMTAVIWPLRARTFWNSRLLTIYVITIWACAFLTTMHWHIVYYIEPSISQIKSMNETTGVVTIIEKPSLKIKMREEMVRYHKIAGVIEMVTLVFVPTILVLSSNIVMILALRQKNRTHDVRIKRQRRATLIVFIIASTFAICQIPSAIVHAIGMIWPEIKNAPEIATTVALINSLVVTGKTANFFLFCTWSSYFRKNLRRVIANKMPFLYHLFGSGLGRIKSTSTLRNSKNRLIEKMGAHRLQSQPQATRLEYCPEGIRVNHSYPLTSNAKYPKMDEAFIDPMVDNVGFLDKESKITPVTDL